MSEKVTALAHAVARVYFFAQSAEMAALEVGWLDIGSKT
jgi:hypothetical protein